MARVRIYEFPSYEDKEEKTNGELIKAVTTHRDFVNTVNGTPRGTIHGYKGEDGKWLNYEQVEILLGIKPRRPFFFEDVEE